MSKFPTNEERLALSGAQEILDFATEQFASMTKFSNDGIVCSYNIPKKFLGITVGCENQCIVGRMITPSELTAMSHYVRSSTFPINRIPASELPVRLKDHRDLLKSLQLVHDTHDHWDDHGFIGWDQLAKVAHGYHLSDTKIRAKGGF